MICYKLFRKMKKDGALKSLFINNKVALPVNEWLIAENHKTNGFKENPGWHACFEPNAPHLTEKGRVWKQVEVEGVRVIKKPKNQGGEWVLASRMRILE